MTYIVTIMAEPILVADSYSEAVETVCSHLPGCELGHPGDITDGGDRTLVWASADDAEGDDGSQAVAEIRVRCTEVLR